MSLDRSKFPNPEDFFCERGLKLVGTSRAAWKTTMCVFHGGSDSMRVNVRSGGYICMACGESGGDVLAYEMASTASDFRDAARRLGAWTDDGQVSRFRKPAPLSPRDAFAVLAREVMLAAVAAGNLAQGVALTDVDRERLRLAASRIAALAECYV